MPPVACAHGLGTRFRLVPDGGEFEAREPVRQPAHTRGVFVNFGTDRVSAKTTENRRGRTVNRIFDGLVGESVNAQSVGNGGNRPTTHTGDTGSPTEEISALQAWVKQGLERGGRPSGPGCTCEECRVRREPSALQTPGAE